MCQESTHEDEAIFVDEWIKSQKGTIIFNFFLFLNDTRFVVRSE